MKIKKFFLIITIILLSITLTSCKRNIKKHYKEFASVSSEYCNIPGLDTKFIPQGMAYNEKYELILISGYYSDDNPSSIFILDKMGNEIKKVTIKTEAGKDYKGHAGGIATYNDLVFLSSGKKVYKLGINKIIDAKNNESVVVDRTTKVDLDGATLFIYENYLFVTEFYYPEDYETDLSHYVETSNGMNKALAFGYEIDESNISGLKSDIPKIAISIPDKVQGIMIKEDYIYFSTSYGRINDSYIRKYKNTLSDVATKLYEYNGLKLPLYIIDEKDLIGKMLAPSMSEGICLVNDKMLILFESGAKKYRLTTKCEVYKIWQSDY